MKRAHIQLSGSNPRIRISRPGFDADSANLSHFLLHENFLFSQPYHFQFVACPFAGTEDTNSLQATVPVAIPAVTPDPQVILYPRSSSGRSVFPYEITWGPLWQGATYLIDHYQVYYNVVSAGQIDITFVKPGNGARAPQGCYLVCARRAT